ncbi:hypothetical protein EJ08DRAFT_681108 [Tothia fuscella]|uniref:Uncharacterized protein n=1 Tax=Tothia fuscella TaxID=1048955 RepID=A0A9P4NLS8_9PEZI|nr:hypothetical protein EJ08DRAFT_681108 [Tothia fuscella]
MYSSKPKMAGGGNNETYTWRKVLLFWLLVGGSKLGHHVAFSNMATGWRFVKETQMCIKKLVITVLYPQVATVIFIGRPRERSIEVPKSMLDRVLIPRNPTNSTRPRW